MFGLGLGMSVARRPSGLLVPGAPAGGPYAVNAVHFDGTNDYVSRGAALTGQVAHAAMIGSVWLLPGVDGSRITVGRSRQATETSRPWEVTREADNKLKVVVRNSANNVRCHWESTDAHVIAGGWVHLLFGINLVASPVAEFYVNDVADAAPIIGPTTDDIAWDTITNCFLGANTSAGEMWNGDMAELYLNNGEYLDFATEANRRKYIDASGFPVELGATGATPTGTAPIIFQEGATAAWHTNKGTGGGFTETGALTDAATSPSD